MDGAMIFEQNKQKTGSGKRKHDFKEHNKMSNDETMHEIPEDGLNYPVISEGPIAHVHFDHDAENARVRWKQI